MYSYDFVRTRGKDKTTRRRPQKADRTLTVSTVSVEDAIRRWNEGEVKSLCRCDMES